ncbi:MAG: sigma-70 family RNA polymerase sigma factor [Planctomycetes bacterium]|jgi:RNA polymerase sigma-70 factor (ECF subfamily)|nr:sigma-70 family RNA polymerase sigma factor [Planctomycetota bacterium]
MPLPPPDAADDLELVRRCNEGDAAEAEAAFTALYHRHRDYVHRLALRYTNGNADLALDVLQETFRYLLRKFPPTGEGLTLTAKLTTFLFPVVKHNALAARRKAQRFTPPPEDAPDQPAPPDYHAEHEPDDFQALLSGLSEERREVLLLRFVDGFSLEEIAEAMAIPVGTVKSRIHLAIKQLRDDPRIHDYFDP